MAALLTAVALVLAALVTGAAAAGPAAANSVEDSFTAKLNGARSARGIPRLTTRSALVTVAREQARRMARSSRLYHNPRLTSEVTNWRWVGENVGYGPSVASVHTAFMNSPAHRSNILDRDYTEVGIGAVVANGRVWVAEVFRRPMRVTTSSFTRPPSYQHVLQSRQHRQRREAGPGPARGPADRLLRQLHQGRRVPVPEVAGLAGARERRRPHLVPAVLSPTGR